MLSWVKQQVTTASLARKARRDEPEVALVRPLCSGGLFVDVGANDGLYSLVAEPHALRVLAIEPHPKTASRLRNTFRGKNVDVLEVALSDASSGARSLFVPAFRGKVVDSRCSLEDAANPGLDQDLVVVESRRLDDIDLITLVMLKVDVEGHELAVLEGARRTLTDQRPRVLVEIEERHHPGRSCEIFAFVVALGYVGFFLDGRRLRSIGEFDPKIHQDPRNIKAVGSMREARYFNNFLFVHESDSAGFAALEGAGFER